MINVILFSHRSHTRMYTAQVPYHLRYIRCKCIIARPRFTIEALTKMKFANKTFCVRKLFDEQKRRSKRTCTWRLLLKLVFYSVLAEQFIRCVHLSIVAFNSKLEMSPISIVEKIINSQDGYEMHLILYNLKGSKCANVHLKMDGNRFELLAIETQQQKGKESDLYSSSIVHCISENPVSIA